MNDDALAPYFSNKGGTLYLGNCLNVITKLESESVNCVITSPPYYNLRDYETGSWQGGDPDCNHFRDTKITDECATGHKGMQHVGVADGIYKSVCKKCGAIRIDQQVGIEDTPDEYISKIVNLFREIRRVLKKDGTVWLNIGDTYANSTNEGNKVFGNPDFNAGTARERTKTPAKKIPKGFKPKDLMMIPARTAIALQEDGWWLRQDIIWNKRNPVPESVTDRCTKSHEYIYLLSKSSKYYFDYKSIEENITNNKKQEVFYGIDLCGESDNSDDKTCNLTKRKRSVWTVNVKAFREAHFAVFPPELITPAVLAGCPEGGIVLDPFFGSGTTGVVCETNNRKWVGIDLNKEYCNLAVKRVTEARHNYLAYNE